MSDELYKTVRIRSDRKIGTDDRGRSVWTKPVEEINLELVSTVMMEQLIHAADDDTKKHLRSLAESENGFVARNPENDEFAILRDDELEAALQEVNDPGSTLTLRHFKLERVDETGGSEELCLVSTQELRKMIGDDEDQSGEFEDSYNPYDSG